jgi:putative transposase
MPFDPKRTNPQSSQFHRRSIRLQGYDYSEVGGYFITVCTYNRDCMFGSITDDKMSLNNYGKIVEPCWQEIPTHFPHAVLDSFVIMPNHVHGIIIIANHVGANNYSPLLADNFHSPSKTIGSIVRGFKIGVTKWFRNNTEFYNIWQRNYHERIIRNESDLNKIREYIIANPLNWKTDKNYKA